MVIVFIVSVCSRITTSNPTSETKKLFEEWISQEGIPYKNLSYEVTTNNGTFSTVRITASLRISPNEIWLEKQADVDCSHVGSKWQCSSAFIFSLTEAEQSKQNQIANGTATSAAIQYQATATDLTQQVVSTRASLPSTQVFMDQNNNATATALSLASTATALAFPSFPQNLTSISGKWYWKETSGPWQGYFLITQSGNRFSGTLDDIWEGTYNDKVINGVINGSSFSFTRDGKYGIQFWYGTIDTNNGLIEINNGLWQKKVGKAIIGYRSMQN